MDKISDAIKCVNCRNVLASPVSLPCGCSICEKHTRDIKGPILCCSCDIEHTTPVNGTFPPNTGLAKIIDAQIEALDFGNKHTEAKQSCTRLNELLSSIETLLKDPFNFTYEAIEHLKSTAQLKVEEMKLKLDNDLARLIGKLDEFMAKCKKTLTSNQYVTKLERFERQRKTARQELDNWVATLNELKLNETKWMKIKEDSEKAIETFELELAKFKNETLLLKRFEEYRVEVEKNYGKFDIDPIFKFR
jgi:hypothetical protein